MNSENKNELTEVSSFIFCGYCEMSKCANQQSNLYINSLKKFDGVA